ncbi:ROK family protein [Rhodococcus sp. 14-2470-1a]|uniref:ROK family protein n=1 Tax=Rhodococcus sp. 14-2470-1a TaxID=2023150 RepID=UPI0015C5ED07|nr:ROK family protein [Rhodococcus sp. 14-2470-1a]
MILSGHLGDGAASSTQLLRRSNSEILLDLFWSAPDRIFTATELMERTTLTRVTVLDVCADLIELEWICEVATAGSKKNKGRPARRFTLSETAAFAVGVDIGYHTATVVVADLRGTVRGRSTHRFIDPDDTSTRSSHLYALIDRALSDAHVSRQSVGAICFGVAAPVDRTGHAPSGNTFWDTVDIDPAVLLHPSDQWAVIVENDANLAALGEQGRGQIDPRSSFVTLLAGERLGAGIVHDGVLLRGNRGGAGELAYLRFVNGVGDTDGIGLLAREWARSELADRGPHSLHTSLEATAEGPVAEDVFAACAGGDPLASDIVDRLGKRLALVISTLVGTTDPHTVIIAGAVAESCDPVIEAVNRHVRTYMAAPPRIVASKLGSDAVLIGAVHAALASVRSSALSG